MGNVYFDASIVAVVVLYVNTVSILKKVKREEDTAVNTIVGSFCLIVILISIYGICGR